MDSSVLALIPARGGSKGLPRKNIAEVAGKPLIYWTINAALSSRSCGRVIVSTEDNEIARVAQSCGAEVPFLRPLALAQDDTPTVEVALHAVESLRQSEGYCPRWLMLLQPTSPLRSAADIRSACEYAMREGVNAVVSVTMVSEHPYWLHRIDEDGCLSPFLPNVSHFTRRQDLPPLFSLNGAIYLVDRETLLRERCLVPNGAMAYVMSHTHSVDIDSALDLQIAESLLLNGGAAL